jgi:hypothetical protein
LELEALSFSEDDLLSRVSDAGLDRVRCVTDELRSNEKRSEPWRQRVQAVRIAIGPTLLALVQAERIDEVEGTIAHVGVEVHVAGLETDRILGNEALEAGVVVARPRVTPAASLAEKSTSPPVRVGAMRPNNEGKIKSRLTCRAKPRCEVTTRELCPKRGKSPSPGTAENHLDAPLRRCRIVGVDQLDTTSSTGREAADDAEYKHHHHPAAESPEKSKDRDYGRNERDDDA